MESSGEGIRASLNNAEKPGSLRDRLANKPTNNSETTNSETNSKLTGEDLKAKLQGRDQATVAYDVSRQKLVDVKPKSTTPLSDRLNRK